MKTKSVIAIACMIFALLSCTTSDPTEAAKNIVVARITAETHGKLKVTAFTKVNATKENVFGVDLYELEYKITVVAVEDGGWISSDAGNTVWFWNVYDDPGDRFARRHLIKKGEIFTSSPNGKITMKKTENGWVENPM